MDQAATDMLHHESAITCYATGGARSPGIVSLRDMLGVPIDAVDPAVWALMQQTMSVITNTGVH